MRSQGYKSMNATTINMDELTFLIVGKTGNGKSSLANLILGESKFQVSTSMTSETTQMSEAMGVVNGEQIKIVDTPDPVNLDLSKTEISAEVARWKSHAVGKFAILLAVRCDVRYTAEEYDIYKKIKIAWGDNSFTNHLVVVFTFGDRQDRNIHEELKTVCLELRSVLADAGNRYVIFNNRAHDSESEKQKLMEYARAPVVPPPSSNLINKPVLLIIFVLIILIIALWLALR
ncbi:GTPase IMAP family member 4-like isoform X2 [Pomacea canaliculata]|uniref:GTPase IMAP family member 4-like isoform X2 n=1 Tax=Pomacea canaliculata TaxID=400727 RepID=UPI000D733E0F|nr:GTPase IMAP family member 4-like isoform X2 [Pomacea canaliculata]XP_025111478.1 GTPase IMAP family member 4-like isoform X2 [Pomacea canaliculata]